MGEDNDTNTYVATDPNAVDLGPPSERITKAEFFYAGEQIAENTDLSESERSRYHAIIRQYQRENGLVD
jgi:hypothetical protein